MYCRADSARLCLSCDRHVHSANALSLRHPRTLLCDGCNLRPATLRCQVENLSLCQACDWETHRSGTPTSLHSRHTFDNFSGCPSAADLAQLWGCGMPDKSVTNRPVKVEGGSQTSPRWQGGGYGHYGRAAGIAGHEMGLASTWMPEQVPGGGMQHTQFAPSGAMGPPSRSKVSEHVPESQSGGRCHENGR